MSETPVPPNPPPPTVPPHHNPKKPGKLVVAGVVVVGLIVVLVLASGWVERALHTVSTDDAYVDGHVTFVAPRVPGQVIAVYVDDNNHVRKGDLLLQLDPEPYQVLVHEAQAAVDAAQADLIATRAQVRSQEGQVRSARFKLDHSIEDVDNQIALLRAKVADVASQQAELVRAQADYNRAAPLLSSGAVTKQEVDRLEQVLLVAKAQVEEAMQEVYQVRTSLGLDIPPIGADVSAVPPDLDQTFSSVKEAQAEVIQDAAVLGVEESFNQTPKQMVAHFYKRVPDGDIDKIYADLLISAPAVKQAKAKVEVAERNLDQAKLNLSYCNVYSEIDGAVTRRNVNPGNNVIAGQSVMAVRSLTEIWITANFKETQIGDMKIGQNVDMDVDTYGSRYTFKGRVTGFEMGTGSTLALLPPENATGNFVKVVQRLPVRIDLVDYDPDKFPLFVGLSVTPYVDVSQPPSGPDAGKVIQPFLPPAAPVTQPTAEPATQPTTQDVAP